MGFGNIGIGELLVIFLVVMIVFGPNRLPEIARSMGKFMRNFQRETNRALNELREGIEPVRAGVFDQPDVVAGLDGEPTAHGTVAAAAPTPVVAPPTAPAAPKPAARTPPARKPMATAMPRKASARASSASGRSRLGAAKKPSRASTSRKKVPPASRRKR